MTQVLLGITTSWVAGWRGPSRETEVGIHGGGDEMIGTNPDGHQDEPSLVAHGSACAALSSELGKAPLVGSPVLTRAQEERKSAKKKNTTLADALTAKTEYEDRGESARPRPFCGWVGPVAVVGLRASGPERPRFGDSAQRQRGATFESECHARGMRGLDLMGCAPSAQNSRPRGDVVLSKGASRPSRRLPCDRRRSWEPTWAVPDEPHRCG